MSYKITLILAVLQFTSGYCQFGPRLTDQQMVEYEIYDSINAHDLLLLEATAQTQQNIQFIPLSADVSVNMFQMKYFFDTAVHIYYPKQNFLAQSYALANAINVFQNSSNVKLEVKNAIFYDEKNTSTQFLDEVKTTFHGEIYNTSFDGKDNETVMASINEWITKNSKGRANKIEHMKTSGKSHIQISLMSYTGCWDKPKNSADSIKQSKFKTASKQEINVVSFNAKETIGYYNNSELKYEAIGIPYKNGEFSLLVVLPYPDQSLELFQKFNTKDFQTMFERVRENQENIDYLVPVLNLNAIKLNENGTSVNGDDSLACDFSSSTSLPHNKTDSSVYKALYVDRPYAIFIYDVKTNIILVHSLVKNPTSETSGLNTLRARNTQFDMITVQSSNLYEIFQIHK